MDISIRPTVSEDCERILELVKELARYERAVKEVTITKEHLIESGFGKNPIWWGFVAQVDGIIQGFALCYIRFSTWKGERLYLEDFYVTESMRGKGLGKLLFNEVLQDAKRRNLNGVSWQVLDWNESAINFYKKYDVVMDEEWINCAISI